MSAPPLAELLAPLFLSHGAPDLVAGEEPARAFLEGLGAALPRPRAVVVASAHWTTHAVEVETGAAPPTIHDFAGFPVALHRLRYPARGAPELAARIVSLLRGAGIAAEGRQRGLDHGAWVPLLLVYPDAGVPVLQVSVQPARGTDHHLAVGRALAPLAREGVLVLGSGGASHNLAELDPGGGAPPAWVRAFDAWLSAAVEAGDEQALLRYRAQAPHAARNHPSEEHYLPLLVAYGAAGQGAVGRVLHHSHTYGVLSMTAFAFTPK